MLWGWFLSYDELGQRPCFEDFEGVAHMYRIVTEAERGLRSSWLDLAVQGGRHIVDFGIGYCFVSLLMDFFLR